MDWNRGNNANSCQVSSENQQCLLPAVSVAAPSTQHQAMPSQSHRRRHSEELVNSKRNDGFLQRLLSATCPEELIQIQRTVVDSYKHRHAVQPTQALQGSHMQYNVSYSPFPEVKGSVPTSNYKHSQAPQHIVVPSSRKQNYASSVQQTQQPPLAVPGHPSQAVPGQPSYGTNCSGRDIQVQSQNYQANVNYDFSQPRMSQSRQNVENLPSYPSSVPSQKPAQMQYVKVLPKLLPAPQASFDYQNRGTQQLQWNPSTHCNQPMKIPNASVQSPQAQLMQGSQNGVLPGSGRVEHSPESASKNVAMQMHSYNQQQGGNQTLALNGVQSDQSLPNQNPNYQLQNTQKHVQQALVSQPDQSAAMSQSQSPAEHLSLDGKTREEFVFFLNVFQNAKANLIRLAHARKLARQNMQLSPTSPNGNTTTNSNTAPTGSHLASGIQMTTNTAPSRSHLAPGTQMTSNTVPARSHVSPGTQMTSNAAPARSHLAPGTQMTSNFVLALSQLAPGAQMTSNTAPLGSHLGPVTQITSNRAPAGSHVAPGTQMTSVLPNDRTVDIQKGLQGASVPITNTIHYKRQDVCDSRRNTPVDSSSCSSKSLVQKLDSQSEVCPAKMKNFVFDNGQTKPMHSPNNIQRQTLHSPQSHLRPNAHNPPCSGSLATGGSIHNQNNPNGIHFTDHTLGGPLQKENLSSGSQQYSGASLPHGNIPLQIGDPLPSVLARSTLPEPASHSNDDQSLLTESVFNKQDNDVAASLEALETCLLLWKASSQNASTGVQESAVTDSKQNPTEVSAHGTANLTNEGTSGPFGSSVEVAVVSSGVSGHKQESVPPNVLKGVEPQIAIVSPLVQSTVKNHSGYSLQKLGDPYPPIQDGSTQCLKDKVKLIALANLEKKHEHPNKLLNDLESIQSALDDLEAQKSKVIPPLVHCDSGNIASARLSSVSSELEAQTELLEQLSNEENDLADKDGSLQITGICSLSEGNSFYDSSIAMMFGSTSHPNDNSVLPVEDLKAEQKLPDVQEIKNALFLTENVPESRKAEPMGNGKNAETDFALPLENSGYLEVLNSQGVESNPILMSPETHYSEQPSTGVTDQLSELLSEFPFGIKNYVAEGKLESVNTSGGEAKKTVVECISTAITKGKSVESSMSTPVKEESSIHDCRFTSIVDEKSVVEDLSLPVKTERSVHDCRLTSVVDEKFVGRAMSPIKNERSVHDCRLTPVVDEKSVGGAISSPIKNEKCVHDCRLTPVVDEKPVGEDISPPIKEKMSVLDIRCTPAKEERSVREATSTSISEEIAEGLGKSLPVMEEGSIDESASISIMEIIPDIIESDGDSLVDNIKITVLDREEMNKHFPDQGAENVLKQTSDQAKVDIGQETICTPEPVQSTKGSNCQKPEVAKNEATKEAPDKTMFCCLFSWLTHSYGSAPRKCSCALPVNKKIDRSSADSSKSSLKTTVLKTYANTGPSAEDCHKQPTSPADKSSCSTEANETRSSLEKVLDRHKEPSFEKEPRLPVNKSGLHRETKLTQAKPFEGKSKHKHKKNSSSDQKKIDQKIRAGKTVNKSKSVHSNLKKSEKLIVKTDFLKSRHSQKERQKKCKEDKNPPSMVHSTGVLSDSALGSHRTSNSLDRKPDKKPEKDGIVSATINPSLEVPQSQIQGKVTQHQVPSLVWETSNQISAGFVRKEEETISNAKGQEEKLDTRKEKKVLTVQEYWQRKRTKDGSSKDHAPVLMQADERNKCDKTKQSLVEKHRVGLSGNGQRGHMKVQKSPAKMNNQSSRAKEQSGTYRSYSHQKKDRTVGTPHGNHTKKRDFNLDNPRKVPGSENLLKFKAPHSNKNKIYLSPCVAFNRPSHEGISLTKLEIRPSPEQSKYKKERRRSFDPTLRFNSKSSSEKGIESPKMLEFKLYPELLQGSQARKDQPGGESMNAQEKSTVGGIKSKKEAWFKDIPFKKRKIENTDDEGNPAQSDSTGQVSLEKDGARQTQDSKATFDTYKKMYLEKRSKSLDSTMTN